MTATFRAWAQVDPTQAVLLQSNSGSAPTGLRSGRYETGEPTSTLKSSKDQNTVKVKKNRTKETAQSSLLPTAVIQPKRQVASDVRAEKTIADDEPSKALELPRPSRTPNLVEQVESLVKGEALPEIEDYREQMHPDDSRLNRLELDAGTGLVSWMARSNSSYRAASFTSPLLQFGASFWATPFVGFSGKYKSTLTADVDSTTVASARVPVTQDWIEMKMSVRDYFGLSRKANSVEYGLLYLSSNLKVPADESSRVRLKSSGVGVYASLRIPVAPTYAWIVGGSLMPRLNHSESGTALGLQSGSGSDSTRLGLLVGGEFKMSRHHAVFWDLTGTLEKNQFTGDSNTNEPGTMTPAHNVSVLNSHFFFNFGYRWGR